MIPENLHVEMRFTPTCVGNTKIPLTILETDFGSPPHAWGILLMIPEGHSDERFTPTCVGNTCWQDL